VVAIVLGPTPFWPLDVLLLVGLITALFARRKGYSAAAWFFASIAGLLFLSFLPFVNRDRRPPEWQKRMKLAGDLIGVVISLGVWASLLIPAAA